jgi:VanZ family protein
MSVVSWLGSRPVVSWVVVVAYALAIFYLSSIPSLEQPLGLPASMSVVEHLAEYIGFGFFVSIAFRSKKVGSMLPAFFLSAFYGLTDEFHQFFVPGRDASMVDFLANTVGCLMGVLVVEYLYRRGNPRPVGGEI